MADANPRSLRNRFFTPRVARALTSPSGILLAGVGAAAGILLGGPVVGAAVGIGAWAARVAAAIPRDDRPQIDLDALRSPWRDYVREALDAQRRYADVVRTARGGPLRRRLEEIGVRLQDGVQESWRIAQRGMALERGLWQLDVPAIQQQLVRAQHEARTTGSSSAERIVESLRAQLGTAERLRRVTEDASSRLRLLDARMDEAVARAVELSLSGDDASVSGLGSEVDNLVLDMEALRQALEETGGTPQIGATG